MSVDAVLLATSDLLVLTALERANARTQPRSLRAAGSASRRHCAHEQHPIHPDRMDHALKDAWVHIGMIAERHAIAVDVEQWAALLDSYTRSILMMGVSHALSRLLPYLEQLQAVGAPDWSDDDQAVG